MFNLCNNCLQSFMQIPWKLRQKMKIEKKMEFQVFQLMMQRNVIKAEQAKTL